MGGDCSREVADSGNNSSTDAAVVDGTAGDDGISFCDACSATSSPIKACILLSDKFSISNDDDNEGKLSSLVLFLVCYDWLLSCVLLEPSDLLLSSDS